ncbi:MAG: restriction endonuclease subunit S [Planctomycetota bacterium]
MIVDLRPYPKTKNSNVLWLGEVPEHWCIKKVRELAKVVNGFPFDSSLFSDSGRYPLIRIRDLNSSRTATRYGGSWIEAARVQPGEVLIGMDGDFNVGTWAGDEPALLNQRVCCVRSGDSASDKFLRYVLPRPLKMINDVTWSTTVRHLASGQVERIAIALPEEAELKAIVRFLDYANGRLERAIRVKRKVIALLQEQKQVIIHRAVTRGLDPSVPLKASGIPWLGDIPEHWEVVRNMALFSHRVEAGVGGLPVLQVSLRSGVTPEANDQFGRPKRLISDSAKYKRIYRGDLAYNTMRMWQGAAGVAPVDGLVSPAYVVLAPRPGASTGFYDHVFHTAFYKDQVNRHSTGIVSDRNRLYWDSFKQMPNIRVPWGEQEAIVAFIDLETRALMTAAGRLEREIDLLREYRTRLVADVVTGKLDVREVAARLPDEAPLDAVECDADLIDETDAVDEEVVA